MSLVTRTSLLVLRPNKDVLVTRLISKALVENWASIFPLTPGHQVDSSNNDGRYSKSNPNPSHALQYDRKLGQQGELRHEVGRDGGFVLEPHHREVNRRHIGQDGDAADWRQEYVHLEPGGDISWDAGEGLHFEAGAMLDRVWTEP